MGRKQAAAIPKACGSAPSSTRSKIPSLPKPRFYGATQNVIVGYDFTRSDKFVLGISGGYEASNYVTKFNAGNEKTGGYNLNPYAAWLMFQRMEPGPDRGVRQVRHRSIEGGRRGQQFFIETQLRSTNLTNISTSGNWKLTSSLGYLWSKRNQDGYTESDEASLTVDPSKADLQAMEPAEEIAYGRGNSETFFGARYEDITNYQNPRASRGLGRAAGQRSHSVVLTAGWRYFGKGLTASFRVQRARGPGAGEGTRFLDGALRMDL